MCVCVCCFLLCLSLSVLPSFWWIKDLYISITLLCVINHNIKILAILPAYVYWQRKQTQHTSWGSCFTTGKFSCLTWADQSPLSHSVVHGPSVSLISGTISKYLNIQELSVTSAGRLVDIVSSSDILNYHKIASDKQLQRNNNTE